MAKTNANGDKITFIELKKRARAKSLSDKELRAYFQLDEKKTKPFKPALKLDTTNVETGPNPPSTDEVNDLYAQATRKDTAQANQTGVAKSVSGAAAKANKSMKSAAKAAKAAQANRILAEGDSWFNLPDLFYPKDAIDFLSQTHPVSSIAKWGDTLQNMLNEKQYRQKLKTGLFRHFLFSGGGNDVLGSIENFVLPRKPGDTDPANAPSYVKPAFANRVKQIIAGYKTLAADVKGTVGSSIILFVHGYANAFPIPDGKYLGKALKKADFDPATHGAMADAVVAHMVKMFNDALKTFAAGQANVVYVDLRPAMKNKSDWNWDEIHPNANGAKKVATALAAAIKANP